MRLLRGILLSLVLSSVPAARCEICDALKSSDIDALFSRTNRQMSVHEMPCCAVWFEVHDGKPGPSEMHGGDEILFVRRGNATVLLGGELIAGKETSPGASTGSGIRSARRQKVGPGDLVNIPRNTPRQIDPGTARVECIAVRIHPSTKDRPARFGTPRKMGDVVTKSEMDALFAKFDTEQPLHSTPNFRTAFVIRKIPSAWESHGCCVDIYLPVHTGTARVLLGGEITNPREQAPGEIRGAGITGAHTYDIGPGDMVLVPRNGAHYIDPMNGKIGYVIVKVRAD